MRFQVLLLSSMVALVFASSKPNDKETLSKFRKRVQGNLTKSHEKTDLYLSRWLKASDYNIDDAEEMFYENLKWRQEMNMDNIENEEPDYVTYIDTHDKQGRPVAHVMLGKWNLRAAVVQGKLPRLTKYTCGIFEILGRKVWKARDEGFNINSMVFIADMEGFSSITHLCSSCISIFINLVDCMETHYPYLTEEGIFKNVSMKSQLMLNAASVVLRKDTAKRIVIFSEKSKWLPYLDDRIERDQRYPNTGGTRDLESSD